jgi:hypothetical protein
LFELGKEPFACLRAARFFFGRPSVLALGE